MEYPESGGPNCGILLPQTWTTFACTYALYEVHASQTMVKDLLNPTWAWMCIIMVLVCALNSDSSRRREPWSSCSRGRRRGGGIVGRNIKKEGEVPGFLGGQYIAQQEDRHVRRCSAGQKEGWGDGLVGGKSAALPAMHQPRPTAAVL